MVAIHIPMLCGFFNPYFRPSKHHNSTYTVLTSPTSMTYFCRHSEHGYEFAATWSCKYIMASGFLYFEALSSPPFPISVLAKNSAATWYKCCHIQILMPGVAEKFFFASHSMGDGQIFMTFRLQQLNVRLVDKYNFGHLKVFAEPHIKSLFKKRFVMEHRNNGGGGVDIIWRSVTGCHYHLQL